MKDLCALNRVQSSTRNVASYHISVDVCFVRVWRVCVWHRLARVRGTCVRSHVCDMTRALVR